MTDELPANHGDPEVETENDIPLDDLLERLNRGDLDAAETILMEYEPQIRIAVSRQLSGALRSKLDTMDVVQAVWTDVIAGFRNNATKWHFEDRRQLKAFLVTLARHRLIDRRRHYRRAIERERPIGQFTPVDLPASPQPRPSEIAQGEELWESILEQCPPAHRDLLRMKREGLPLAEIARRSGLHEGSIRRILYETARRMAKAGAGNETTEDDSGL